MRSDNLVSRYDQNRFIASCRIAAYRSNFKHDFNVIELADFDNKQIKQFITNWFSTDLDQQSNTADKCWTTLNQENNKAAKELAQTPLLLTFLCLVYNRKQSFPPTRSRLYNKALDILLEEWAAEKRIQQEVIHEGLHTDLEKVMLAEIAHEGFVNDELFFNQQKIVNLITDFLADSVANPKYLDGKKILNAIAAQQGILVQRAEDIYSFSHLTLQEYLIAQYISQKDSRIEELVTKHLTDKRWKEIFLLVAGLKDDAGELLKLIETAAQKLINTDKLHNLLVWVRDHTDNSSGDIQPVGKRAISLAHANILAHVNDYTLAYRLAQDSINQDTYPSCPYVQGIAYAHDLVYAKTYILAYTHNLINPRNYILAYTRDLINAYALTLINDYALGYKIALKNFIQYVQLSEEFQVYQDANYFKLIDILEKSKLLIPDDSKEKKVRQDFGKRIIEIWLTAFKLKPEMIDLSQKELIALDNYLYANLLMVECQKAAVRVSRRTWTKIESRMLMP